MADKAENGHTATRRARRAVAGQGEGTVTTRRTTTAGPRPAAGNRSHAAVAAGARTAAATAQVPDGPLDPSALPVRPGEDLWTAEEVAELRQELTDEVQRLQEEIENAEAAITGMMRDSGDGAGDDQVDAGTKNISREHELSLANNARDMLAQTERALGRLEGTGFGVCESCGNAIGKARLQAFPRATLCVQCKAKQERR